MPTHKPGQPRYYITLNVTREEFNAYTSAAAKDDRKVAPWCRRMLNAALAKPPTRIK